MESVPEEGEIVEQSNSTRQTGEAKHGSKRLKVTENKYKTFLFTEFSQDIEGNDLEELAHRKIPIKFAREVGRIATREAEKLEDEMERQLQSQKRQIKNLTLLLEDANGKRDKVSDRFQAELAAVSKERDEAAKARDRLITTLNGNRSPKTERAKVIQLEEKVRMLTQNFGTRTQDLQGDLSRAHKEHGSTLLEISKHRSELQKRDAGIVRLENDLAVERKLRESAETARLRAENARFDAEKRAQDAERRLQDAGSRCRNFQAGPWDAAFAGQMRTVGVHDDAKKADDTERRIQKAIEDAERRVQNGECRDRNAQTGPWDATNAGQLRTVNSNIPAEKKTEDAEKRVRIAENKTGNVEGRPWAAAFTGPMGTIGTNITPANVGTRHWDAAFARQIGTLNPTIHANVAWQNLPGERLAETATFTDRWLGRAKEKSDANVVAAFEKQVKERADGAVAAYKLQEGAYKPQIDAHVAAYSRHLCQTRSENNVTPFSDRLRMGTVKGKADANALALKKGLGQEQMEALSGAVTRGSATEDDNASSASTLVEPELKQEPWSSEL
ncbi:hypothetical protein K490DRAFT_68469 [Saccharata proteae CBS 121410]|uniref:Uncharacterized protein n=1 Tax=Saccharata proteae CBS 121410 TaxID=1314787 RepID=A0A9P4HPT4_9PEZI|nr:hypothetical protein K490DRAFT_68469 [Saccharata proteae CBS 121410]